VQLFGDGDEVPQQAQVQILGHSSCLPDLHACCVDHVGMGVGP
jgi:hypothetical protein